MGRLSRRVKEMVEADRIAAQQPQDAMQMIINNESGGKLGLIDDIKKNPIPGDIAEEIIGGIPINWHELESFVVSISPSKFVTLLKLQKQMIKDYGMRFSGQRRPTNFKFLFILILAISLAGAGIFVMMYLPQILAMFQMGF